MQPGHKMSDFPEAGAFEYLRTQAIARLYLDNIPNIQSSWVTQGAKIGQLALFFGANDMGSPDDRGERRRVGRARCIT